MLTSAFPWVNTQSPTGRAVPARRPSRPRRPAPRRRSAKPELVALESRNLLSGVWTPLTNLVPSDTGTSTMTLLSDGTVMVQGGGTPQTVTKTWYQLTPDASGSYVDGTWSQLPSMSLERYAYASNVLPDGRVFVLGGEYSGPDGAQNWTNTGEIYDPVQNTWTPITNFPRTQFGDDPSEVLPDGRVLVGYLSSGQTYIYDPAGDTWTQAATKLRNDRSDEETWMKLPDGSILTYDIFDTFIGPSHSQRYIPSLNQWVDAGDVPVALSSSAVGSELGPAFLLPDGRAFFFGATGHTAYYDPSTNSWTAGPDLPDDMSTADMPVSTADVPGAMMPNGKILFAAGPMPFFSAPTSVFEFDPVTNTYTDVTPSDYDLSLRPNDDRMLVLPSGQILFTNDSDQLMVYTPDGSPDPSWQPTIHAIHNRHNGTYRLVGSQINGISEGASYGDDAEMYTNYPIVRLTGHHGEVFYARTYNWSSTGVATGDARETVSFTLPAGIPSGRYHLSVIANGIASDPVEFRVRPSPPAPGEGSGSSSGSVPAPAGVAEVTPPAPSSARGPDAVAVMPGEAASGAPQAQAGGLLTSFDLRNTPAQGDSGTSASVLLSPPVRTIVDGFFASDALFGALFDDLTRAEP
jgi:hypothetical protein